MPWRITLAVGAVLLSIAVTYERRAGEEHSITDRLRDRRWVNLRSAETAFGRDSRGDRMKSKHDT
jgi:hypothetical protein